MRSDKQFDKWSKNGKLYVAEQKKLRYVKESLEDLLDVIMAHESLEDIKKNGTVSWEDIKKRVLENE